MMRKLFIFISIISLIGCQRNETYIISPYKLQQKEKHILLMHPTVNNIRTFEYLVKSKIFPIPDGYCAIGIYHQQEMFDYSKTEEFLRQEGITNVKLMRIEAQLSPDNIYKENGCSSIFKKLFENSNGAIFFGGPDIPPACYGETTNLLTVITDPYRHYMELSFLFHLLGGNQDSTYIPLLKNQPNYPILGICLGMQSINVATGGTLVQDIPTELYCQKYLEQVLTSDHNQQHRNYYVDYSLDSNVTYYYPHQIEIEKNSPLVSYILSDTIHPFVWSSHHQCIKKLGKGIKVAARSIDGKIIESITHHSYPNILGVQFHPEKRELYEPDEKIKVTPSNPAKYSYLDKYSGDRGENFQRAIWRKFAEKFK